MGESCPELASAGGASVGDGLRELPRVFACFGAADETRTRAGATERGVSVVLRATTRQGGKRGVVGDDPGALAVSLCGVVYRAAPVFAEVHGDKERVAAPDHLLPPREVEGGGVAPGRSWVLCDDDVACVGRSGVESRSKRDEGGAVPLPGGAIWVADWVGERARAPVVELPVAE